MTLTLDTLLYNQFVEISLAKDCLKAITMSALVIFSYCYLKHNTILTIKWVNILTPDFYNVCGFHLSGFSLVSRLRCRSHLTGHLKVSSFSRRWASVDVVRHHCAIWIFETMSIDATMNSTMVLYGNFVIQSMLIGPPYIFVRPSSRPSLLEVTFHVPHHLTMAPSKKKPTARKSGVLAVSIDATMNSTMVLYLKF